MSQINFTRKTFLEKEEIARLQEFLRDSPSENAIIGNTSRWGILRTDFQNDTDFLVEPSSNSGRVKIEKAENKAIAKGGKMIYQEAIDNIEVPNDNKWYWMRIKYKYVTYEKGTVSINSSGQVIGTGTSFRDVLRGQATLVPTKVKFLKLDGSQAVNSGFYEVVDITDNNNITLTSAIDFVAESNLRMVVLGTTPLGEMLSTEQKEGLYKYDSCEIELIAEDEDDTETPPHRSTDNPDLTFIQDEMFYISRVKNNAGFVDVDNSNPYVRNEFWEFNVVGLTDKLGSFNNLSDVQNPDAALTNLGVTTAGKSFAKISTNPYPSYLRLEANGTVKKMIKEAVVDDFRNYLNTMFLQRTKNLDELTDVAAARTNLDVYSKGEFQLNWVQLTAPPSDYTVDASNAYVAKTVDGRVVFKGYVDIVQNAAVPFVAFAIVPEAFRPNRNITFMLTLYDDDEFNMVSKLVFLQESSGNIATQGGTFSINLESLSYYI